MDMFLVSQRLCARLVIMYSPFNNFWRISSSIHCFISLEKNSVKEYMLNLLRGYSV